MTDARAAEKRYSMKSLRELFTNNFHTPPRDVLVWFFQPILLGFFFFFFNLIFF
jgi:hypothetical protein